jgi:hypothetical protein
MEQRLRQLKLSAANYDPRSLEESKKDQFDAEIDLTKKDLE